jgi:serine/threonine-protein kinase
MKRCPQCGREYDISMSFCLDDGAELLYGPAEAMEPATAILHGTAASTAVMESRKKADNDPKSIAVLPFAHLSSEPDDEYFCEGLAEEILNALTKIGDLKVSARTSAFSFKGKDIGLAAIGETLGVSSILEGSVRKSGDHIRITVQLINASDGYQVWSERYDRKMKGIFALQDEITLAVVDALKVKLLGDERSAVLKKGTKSPEAYELYLRGRFLWNRRTPADFELAIEQFQKAIEIDPGYALAYSGIADCLLFLGYYEACSPAEAAPKAKKAVEKALAMDDTLAEAQASMAVYKIYFEFDWKGGEEGLRKAIELNPKLPTARYWYCSILDALGRFDESIEQGRIAQELDPLDLITPGNIVRALTHARRYREAIDLALKTLEIAPEFYVTHWALGVVYMNTGNLEEAVERFRFVAAKSGFLFLRAYLGFALAMSGNTDEAKEILAELNAEKQKRYVSPLCMCVIHIGLGEIDFAVDRLEDAWQMRTILLMWIKTEPIFDALRDEPRFKSILQLMDLSE